VKEPDTVIFHLSHPDPNFLYAVALRFMNIVPKGSPHKHTDMPPPMTGAYMMTSRVPNRSVSFRRNPYWAANAQILGVDATRTMNVDGIDVAIGQSADQIYLQLKNNQIDFDVAGTEELQPPQLQEIATTPDLKSRFYRNPDSRIDYYWMNAHIKPFDNLKLRQAVNYALDRQVQGKLLGGAVTGEPWSQILSRPPMKSYVSDTTAYPASPDLAKAKQLVQESGVKMPIPVTLAFNNSSPIPAQSASALKNDLSQIGFQVTIKPIDPSAYYQAIQNPKKSIQIGWAGWTQDYTDGSAFFGPLLSDTSVTNYAQYQSKTLQAAIDKISAMPSGPDREKAWAQLSDDTSRADAPWAVYDNRNFYELVSNRYGGYAWAPTKQRYYALAYLR
jgi:peptide/nickel transport system substrate-binding protein